jgi:PAXNEB protein
MDMESDTRRCFASQDVWKVQARALVTHFLAEGLACGHQILHASSCDEDASLEARLPRICAGARQEPEVPRVAPGAASELQIAWQYRRCL